MQHLSDDFFVTFQDKAMIWFLASPSHIVAAFGTCGVLGDGNLKLFLLELLCCQQNVCCQQKIDLKIGKKNFKKQWGPENRKKKKFFGPILQLVDRF